MIKREILHFHLFCGLGGGAKGFNAASPRVGNLQAKFRCIGGVDVDPAAIRDFDRLTGTRGTVLDMFDRSQYIDFHGCEPGQDWRESTPADIRRAAGGERPNIVFLSAPCKGFSGLLNETKSKSDKYQALNCLTIRGIWLMLEAWADDPPELIVFENVPRIASRGRHLLEQIGGMLESYGYAVAETTHDCGELGGLAQSRKRFLLVARHVEKVPPFLYEPEKKRLQSVGTVLDRMPLPGNLQGGPMHRIPRLSWKTWVRLAFVEAGSDWRSLNRLEVEDGYLKDFLIVPEYRDGFLGVNRWEDASGTVAGKSGATNGNFSVADPRTECSREGAGYLGVNEWENSMGTVTANGRPGAGAFSIADPRCPHSTFQPYGVISMDDTSRTIAGGTMPGQGSYAVADPRHRGPAKHSNEFRIISWDRSACAVTSAHGSGHCVADPRREGPTYGKYCVTDWADSSGTVISGSTTGQGAFSIADPRPGLQRERGDHYLTAGHYGVCAWDDPCVAVSAAAGHDNGRWSIADPRLPGADDKLVAVIRALDGTWHRPFTTLELAALQSLVEPEEQLELDGLSDSAWRERIGNAVPPAAAQAIAEVMGTTLLLAWSGETFVLSAMPIWVRPVAVALAISTKKGI